MEEPAALYCSLIYHKTYGFYPFKPVGYPESYSAETKLNISTA
jgi:hypothetical protein